MLQTKFLKPFLTPDIIQRPRLSKILVDISSSVLVCAPAGYDKSIAVSQWLEKQSGNYMWLSLDEEQNDLSSFLEYFSSGIETINPLHFTELKRFIYSHQVVAEVVL